MRLIPAMLVVVKVALTEVSADPMKAMEAMAVHTMAIGGPTTQ